MKLAALNFHQVLGQDLLLLLLSRSPIYSVSQLSQKIYPIVLVRNLIEEVLQVHLVPSHRMEKKRKEYHTKFQFISLLNYILLWY